MTPQELDFTIVTRAGLTQKEFADLCGVSRVTANMWVRGKMKPHRYIKTKAARLVELLEKAVLHETLPVQPKLGAVERPLAIQRAVRQAQDTAIT